MCWDVTFQKSPCNLIWCFKWTLNTLWRNANTHIQTQTCYSLWCFLLAVKSELWNYTDHTHARFRLLHDWPHNSISWKKVRRLSSTTTKKRKKNNWRATYSLVVLTTGKEKGERSFLFLKKSECDSTYFPCGALSQSSCCLLIYSIALLLPLCFSPYPLFFPSTMTYLIFLPLLQLHISRPSTFRLTFPSLSITPSFPSIHHWALCHFASSVCFSNCHYGPIPSSNHRSRLRPPSTNVCGPVRL